MASSPITSWQIYWEKMETMTDFIFLGPKTTVDSDCNHEIKRPLLLRRKAMTNLDSIWKSRDITLPTSMSSQSYGFSSSHVWMWELDHKEGWASKNWYFWMVVVEKILESPLDCKKIQPINPKGNQLWIFVGRADAKAEAPLCWPPDVKSRFIWKDPDAGKDLRQEEKEMTKDEVVGWHHKHNGHEFEQLWEIGKDEEAWPAAVHGVTKNWIWLSDWTATDKQMLVKKQRK